MSPRSERVVEGWPDRTGPYYLLHSLSLVPPDDPDEAGDFDAVIELASVEDEALIAVLRCYGVSKLSVKAVQHGVRVGPLAADDLRARGWEGIAYEIYDPEPDDKIRLLCRRISWTFPTGG